MISSSVESNFMSLIVNDSWPTRIYVREIVMFRRTRVKMRVKVSFTEENNSKHSHGMFRQLLRLSIIRYV
jgi:hypothetical protein